MKRPGHEQDDPRYTFACEFERACSYGLRATINTAIGMASAMGRGSEKSRQASFKETAWEYFLGEWPVLNSSIRIRQADEYGKRVMRTCKKTPGFVMDEGDLDVVITAIDGAESLASGESGSVSVIAIGERKWFQDPSGDDQSESDHEQSFLCIAADWEHLNEASVEAVKTAALADKPLKELFGGSADQVLIDNLLQVPDGLRPVIATMFPDQFSKLKLNIQREHSVRQLHGSAFAAAMAAYTGKVTCSVFVSRLPQVLQTAAAARGLHGQLLAIPLFGKEIEKTVKPKKNAMKATKIQAISEETAETTVATEWFVAKSNVLTLKNLIQEQQRPFIRVICTSISEVCVLDRVRVDLQRSPGEKEMHAVATVDTIIVDTKSESVVRQSTTLRLDQIDLRRVAQEPVKASEYQSSPLPIRTSRSRGAADK